LSVHFFMPSRKKCFTLHAILLGMGGTSTTLTHRSIPWTQVLKLRWVLKFRLKFASKLHVHSVDCAAKVVNLDMPFSVPLPTLTRSRFQAKPVILLILTVFLFSLVRFFVMARSVGRRNFIWEGGNDQKGNEKGRKRNGKGNKQASGSLQLHYKGKQK